MGGAPLLVRRTAGCAVGAGLLWYSVVMMESSYLCITTINRILFLG